MRRAIGATLLLVTLLAGCGDGGDGEPAASASASVDVADRYSAEVRANFLTSCVRNARASAGDEATERELDDACECLLRRFEEDYSEDEFAELERKLGDGEATGVDLDDWATECTKEAIR